MNTGNPYRPWIEGFAEALRVGEAIDATAQPRPAPPKPAPGAAKALIFSPHPDDEVIIGGLPLRLMRELGCEVINVAVTFGSNKDRRAARWGELRAACEQIGFALMTPDANGLEGINLEQRERQPECWAASVNAVAAILAAERPAIIFLPHAQDWNLTHVGTHHLVLDALRGQPGLACQVVETEYWSAMTTPNLIVESSAADVADLVAALSLHAGEVARNPYHLRLPAWMMDNVRRGAELVGGQGAPAPGFAFATLYRLRGWAEGGWQEVLEQGRSFPAASSLRHLFPTMTQGGSGWRHVRLQSR